MTTTVARAVAQDDLSITPPDQRAGSPKARLAIYLLVLIPLSVSIFFYRINAVPLQYDEARYANCVLNIRQTGEWMTITDVIGKTYFQKPPLYMWLSAMTFDSLGPGEIKFRFWSATFGVCCVVLTCALGYLLLSPEIGLTAALLLMVNEDFLFDHGARTGTMDSMLTCWLLAATILYWLNWYKNRWWIWTATGVVAALASLTKPLFGFLIILVFAIHLLLTWRSANARKRMLGLMLAAVISLILAGPWYAMQYVRFHQQFLKEMFQANMYHRITAGFDPKSILGPLFFVQTISRSSFPFMLFVPAVAFSAIRGSKRNRSHGLVAAVILTWLMVFSVSISKYQHYAFPIFPLIAISVCALCAAVFRWSSQFIPNDNSRRRFGYAMAALLIFAFVIRIGRLLDSRIPNTARTYVPWALYETFEPAIEAGQMRLVFFGFGKTPLQWEQNVPKITWGDSHYLRQMDRALFLDTDDELRSHLRQREPALIFFSRQSGDIANFFPVEQLDERCSHQQTAFLIEGLNMSSLLDVTVKAGTTRFIQSDDHAFHLTAGFQFRITHPLRQPAWLITRLKSASQNDPSDCEVRINGKTVRTTSIRRTADGYEILAHVRAKEWRGDGPQEITFAPHLHGTPTSETTQIDAIRLTFELPALADEL